ncbi:MAG: hypothetical protein VXY93_12855, partial [Pseudomonadota bacterium]|nr:hypothetical protein [Pseudomonadota bacterium]
MVIKHNGYVGIGDDAPDYMLQLKGTIPAIALEDTSGTHGLSVIEQNDDNLKIRCDAGNASSGYNSNIRFEVDGTEKVRITSFGYVHLGNAGHGTNKVGGQAVTGEDFNPYFKMYASTSNHWLMQLRSDTGTGSNGIFMRAGTNSNDYTAYLTGRDEHVKHFIVRGDGNIGIGTDNPSGKLDISAANSTDMLMFKNGATNFARLGYNSASGTAILDVRSEGHTRFLTNGNNERLRISSDGEVKINGDGSGTGYLRIVKDRDSAYSSGGGNNQDLIIQQISNA